MRLLRGALVPLVLLALPAPALASFPGANGRIAYQQTGSDPEDDTQGERQPDGASDIWTIDPGGSARTNVTRDPETDSDPAYSPDGMRVAYARAGYRFCNTPGCDAQHIWVVEADGSGKRQVTSGGYLFESDPSFSRDGTRILFARWDGGRQALYLIGVDGSGETELVPGDGVAVADPREPSFSPDGSQIVFVGSVPYSDDGRTREDSEIFVMNADGSGVRRLTQNAGSASGSGSRDASPSFSPDGRRIVWASAGDIWVMNADGSAPQQLTTGDRAESAPAFSPDGRQIAFTKDIPWSYSGAFSGGNSEIFTMNADGSGERNVTQDREAFGLPQSEPDWGVGRSATLLEASTEWSQPVQELRVEVGCEAACDVEVSGRAVVTLRPASKARTAAKRRLSFPLKRVRRSLAAGERRSLRLRLKRRKARTTVTRLLKRGARAKALVTVEAVDEHGEVQTKKLRIKLRRGGR